MEASWIGEAAAEHILGQTGLTGLIISTSRNSAVVGLEHDDLLVITASTVRAPYGVGVSWLPPQASQGQEVNVGNGTLKVGGLRIRISERTFRFVCSPVMIVEDPYATTERLTSLLRLAQVSAPASSLLYSRSRGRAARVLAELLRTEPDDPALASILTCLVGLGLGYTPSGDDFVSGYLFMRQCCCPLPKNCLDQVLGAARKKTTLYSWRMMAHAAEGRIFEPHYRLARHLAFGEGEDVEVVAACVRVGHASGYDMMVGMLAAGCHLNCFLRPLFLRALMEPRQTKHVGKNPTPQNIGNGLTFFKDRAQTGEYGGVLRYHG